MPVTPQFSLRQDESFVYVDVRVPFVRVSDLDYVIDGENLSLFVKPYLLQLQFPGEVLDDERTKAVYDAEENNGTVHLHLPKAVPNQTFDGLDLLTKLRQPRRSNRNAAGPSRSCQSSIVGNSSLSVDYEKERELLDQLLQGRDVLSRPSAHGEEESQHVSSSKPMIQVLSSTEFNSSNTTDFPSESQSSSADVSNSVLSAQQSMPSEEERVISKLLAESSLVVSRNDATDEPVSQGEPSIIVGLGQPCYGFNHGTISFFGDIEADFPELIDLPRPDETPEAERRILRIDEENESFDVERYLGDYFQSSDDPFLQEAVAFNPDWDLVGDASFSENENKQMINLQNREFLTFEGFELQRALCAILDVVIASIYDLRMTQGEPSVESAWTIRKLSSTLSWLDFFETPLEVAGASLHRMITYPFIRTVDFACKILQDTKTAFQKDIRHVLKRLLAVHRIFSRSEQFYLLNRLYVTDMCVWLQQIERSVYDSFVERVIQSINLILNCPFEYLRWDIENLPTECQERATSDE